ncbi:MAG: prepilin-type N-terminal cleavage/methylation domain-containing protein [Desulfotomaculaceae bacterium]|nr:prepilin-type N-terminal cleavage/methylation domain-containing protein [Desulfotomaculaceae bacterium]
MFRLLLNQRGMSLIEVTVAILILGITTFPLIYMYRDGSIQAAAARDEVSALNFARALVEEIKSIPESRLGLCRGADAHTVTLEHRASGIDDFYKGFNIAICGGTGAGQVKKITGYDGPARSAVLESDWLVVPDATSLYMLYHDCPGNYRYVINVENNRGGLKMIRVTVYYTVKNQERQVSLTTEKLTR